MKIENKTPSRPTFIHSVSELMLISRLSCIGRTGASSPSYTADQRPASFLDRTAPQPAGHTRRSSGQRAASAPLLHRGGRGVADSRRAARNAARHGGQTLGQQESAPPGWSSAAGAPRPPGSCLITQWQNNHSNGAAVWRGRHRHNIVCDNMRGSGRRAEGSSACLSVGVCVSVCVRVWATAVGGAHFHTAMEARRWLGRSPATDSSVRIRCVVIGMQRQTTDVRPGRKTGTYLFEACRVWRCIIPESQSLATAQSTVPILRDNMYAWILHTGQFSIYRNRLWARQAMPSNLGTS